MLSMNYWRIMNPSTYGDAQVTLLATEDEEADLFRIGEHLALMREIADDPDLYQDAVFERWESWPGPGDPDEDGLGPSHYHLKAVSIQGGRRTEHRQDGSPLWS